MKHLLFSASIIIAVLFAPMVRAEGPPKHSICKIIKALSPDGSCQIHKKNQKIVISGDGNYGDSVRLCKDMARTLKHTGEMDKGWTLELRNTVIDRDKLVTCST